MGKSDAIDFLRENQPLPDDGEEFEAVIDTFDDVREYFLHNPDPACIPLFLNCFGRGSGYGVYQLIEGVIEKYDGSIVIPHLKKALRNEAGSIRYWCSQIAMGFDIGKLVDELIDVYEKGDPDEKVMSLTALEMTTNPKVIALASMVLRTEMDEDLLEIAADILKE